MTCEVCFERCKCPLECPKCGTSVCESCQLQFGQPACVKCAHKFAETFLKRGHASLIKSLLRPAEENMFWDREKALLPGTQVLLDWELQVEQLSKQLRFGFNVQFPPKPVLVLSSTGRIFPCPSSECRGFVSGNTCGACKRQVCDTCHESMSVSHTCNADSLASLALLAKDSKPCPKCCTLIFRTQGCDHMFCTCCRTHFDWMSSKVLSSSTNHHYDASPTFANNLALLNVKPSQSCSFEDALRDAVHSSRVATDSKAFRMLWKEPLVLRTYVRTQLDIVKLLEKHEQALVKLRIQFLRELLTEDAVKKKVWMLEKQYELKLAERALLEEFLRVINDLQLQPFDEDKLVKMTDLFTQCFKELGSKIKLQAKDQAPILLL